MTGEMTEMSKYHMCIDRNEMQNDRNAMRIERNKMEFEANWVAVIFSNIIAPRRVLFSLEYSASALYSRGPEISTIAKFSKMFE
jgi:hypothetical protein